MSLYFTLPPNAHSRRLRAHLRGKKGKMALTLIELLIAITLVAFLAALLFSVNTRLRRSLNKAQNIEKLRTIGVAVFAYAADHNGKLPGNTPDGLLTRHIGNGMSSRTAVRKLFSQRNHAPVGQGTNDYLPSPDCLYGPFTQASQKRTPGTFYYAREAGTYRSGYCVYSLPRHDQRGSPPVLDGCFNDRITENPRAPIFSDHIDWNEFTGTEISVLFLDGSLREYSKEEVSRRSSSKSRLQLFSGIQ